MGKQLKMFEQGSYKNDSDKPDHSLISPHFRTDMAEALGTGAAKYGRSNWLLTGLEFSRVIGAAHRHLAAWEAGEETDPETGISHLAHAGCCLMMLHEYQRVGYCGGRLDDRHFCDYDEPESADDD